MAGSGKDGSRFAKMATWRWRSIPSLPHRCLLLLLSRLAGQCCPQPLHLPHCQPPKDFSTMGIKATPCFWALEINGAGWLALMNNTGEHWGSLNVHPHLWEDIPILRNNKTSVLPKFNCGLVWLFEWQSYRYCLHIFIICRYLWRL